jgi:hypothetical protein
MSRSVALRIIWHNFLRGIWHNDDVQRRTRIVPARATRRRTAKDFAGGALNESRKLQKVTKEVVGIHVLLKRSLFACDILRRLLRRVSPLKSTSAPLRF